MRTKHFLAGALAAVTLTVIGGCAAQKIEALEPKLELRNAAQQLADAQQAGFTLKVTGNADDLIAAINMQAKQDKSAEAAVTAEDATVMRQLFKSSFTIAYDKAGAGPEDDQSMIAATVDGVAGTEIRYVDGKLYAKAPVAELATKFGASAAEVESLSGAAVGDLPGLDAFFDGKWVAVDGKEITDLASAGAGLPAQDLEQKKVIEELTASATNLVEGATVTRDSADDKHLIVTSSSTKAYAEAKRFASAVDKELVREFTAPPKDRPIVLDLWIDGGKLTAAELNVLQFVDGATGRVAARLEVTTGLPIAVPEGAAKIDLAGLLGPGATD
ncbi:hypothetical protein AB0M36_05815 [Actinoplanes sp. NPDC051346]|uniref:hypothetical protein n=1 Tax=Actinoplanes sp. NPDC051346 TaxID=3155048 RepID=UPI003447033A